jgi:pentatricopeptide repeat protein
VLYLFCGGGRLSVDSHPPLLNLPHPRPQIKPQRYAIARPDLNEHTFAAVFGALSSVGRTDEAVAVWEQLSAANVDVGPVGASAIIKACARTRDVASGLRIFERMLRRRVTFNRYTYNAVRRRARLAVGLGGTPAFLIAASALPPSPPPQPPHPPIRPLAQNPTNQNAPQIMHLCAITSRADDALAVYNLMRLETDPNNLPDKYTYAALIRAIVLSKRYEMAASVSH